MLGVVIVLIEANDEPESVSCYYFWVVLVVLTFVMILSEFSEHRVQICRVMIEFEYGFTIFL